MIVYFADRRMNILGHASTGLFKGLSIADDLKTEDVETGVATFECTIQFDNETRSTVESCTEVGNYILKNVDDEQEFYTIIDSEIDTQNKEVRIYAENAGLDLINEIVGAYTADKEYPISHYINKFAYDSGFKIGINEVETLTRKLNFDDEVTVTERIASVASQFGGCEVSYRFKIKGFKVVNKYIDIYEKRGKDIGVQLHLNKDIDRIITKKSIANIATALQCEGSTPDNAENPITLSGFTYDDGDFFVSGKRLYSRKAIEKWGRYVWEDEPNQILGDNGHIVRFFSYDTVKQSTLCSKAIAELKKLREIEVNYEVEIARLPDNVKVGDRVTVIDDAGEFYLSTRILALETSVVDNTHKATLGEYLIKKSGISQTVMGLAEQLSKSSQSATNATTIASNAQKQANAAVSATEALQVQIGTANITLENALDGGAE